MITALAVIGIGLVAAPAIFEMFSRAPLGGQMINEFRPFMRREVTQRFAGYLDVIGDAEAQAQSGVRAGARDRLAPSDAQFDARYPQLAVLHRQWPGIRADMSSMLATMSDNLDNFAAVDALPPFPLFPWFFVLPGVMLALLAGWAFRTANLARPVRGPLIAIGVLGIGIAAAPAIFQMFSRAPLGAQMIDGFRPIMTTAKVTSVQQYFLAIGGGEGELRTRVRPDLERAALLSRPYEESFPALARLAAEWPRMSRDLAPMVGAMSDNVDNFAAVDALPPFGLFPWFFVVPGILIAGLAAVALRSEPRGDATSRGPGRPSRMGRTPTPRGARPPAERPDGKPRTTAHPPGRRLWSGSSA